MLPTAQCGIEVRWDDKTQDVWGAVALSKCRIYLPGRVGGDGLGLRNCSRDHLANTGVPGVIDQQPWRRASKLTADYSKNYRDEDGCQEHHHGRFIEQDIEYIFADDGQCCA